MTPKLMFKKVIKFLFISYLSIVFSSILSNVGNADTNYFIESITLQHFFEQIELGSYIYFIRAVFIFIFLYSFKYLSKTKISYWIGGDSNIY